MKKNPAILKAIANVKRKSKKEPGFDNKGEIAPAENQATAIFPATSDARFNWESVNLNTEFIFTYLDVAVNRI